VVSEVYGIPYGEVRGRWEPLVTSEEFERGVEILRKHDAQKSRVKRHHYLLRNILRVRANGRTYKMYGTTPSGRSKSYSYYMTQAKPNGSKIHIPCAKVDGQIAEMLRGIVVDPELAPKIKEVYRAHVEQVTDDDRQEKMAGIKQRLQKLREEEAHLGRLVVTGKISEKTFDQLHAEWQEKILHMQSKLDDLERETGVYLNELDAAIALMPLMQRLFERLKKKERATLLQILVKCIIVDPQGEVIDYKLNSPFAYIRYLADQFEVPESNGRGSEQVQVPPLVAKSLLSAYIY
jgi:hypothetical protein